MPGFDAFENLAALACRWSAGVVLAAAASGLALAQSSVVTTEHVRAELVAHAPEGIAAGKPLRLGLKLRHAPEWHTYWKNPGDSGLPTTFAWTLPAGVAIGEIRWPVPQAIKVGPLVNYGYEGEIVLAADAVVPAGFAAPSLDVRLQAEWLVCREVCIPESGTFALRIPSDGATAGDARAFAAAAARLPKAAPGAVARASFDAAANALVIVADRLPTPLQGRTLELFAETAGVVEHAAPFVQSWQGDRFTARIPLSAQRSESPQMLPVLVVDAASRSGWTVPVTVAGWPGGAASAKPAVAAPATTAPAVAAAAPGDRDARAAAQAGGSAAATGITLAAALGLAFIGGLLLNLMPCVFPVLSLKLISFAGPQSGRTSRAAHGLAYTAGVVVSFVALAAVLLTLRAGGERLGWGFQLQSPLFVAALAVLFTLVGLNLAGVFEVGRVLPTSIGSARLRHPLADDALTGVLAVAVASPCTAPFMGVATGATLTMAPAAALAVFAAIGLGMAMPFLLASLVPQAARLMPRAGPWLARFRTAMAFPMFATVAWLVWVLGKQAGIDGVAVLLILLVAVAFGAWVLGTPGFRARSRLLLGTLAAAFIGVTIANGWPMLVYPDPETARVSGSGTVSDEAGLRWRPWSARAVADVQRAGRPVFVDFTAAWCITCQVNKRTTLANDAVLADLRAGQVVLMRADWTLRDSRITAELQRLGRRGVPVYALYPADGSAPRLLPELITPGDVREALRALPGATTMPVVAPLASVQPNRTTP